MKKKILILCIVLLFSFVNIVAAQEAPRNITVASMPENESLSENITLPNQFGYDMKRFGEKIRLFFTLSKRNRVQYRLELANRRAAELKQIINKNMTEYVEEIVKDYNKSLQNAQRDIEELEKNGKKVAKLRKHVSNMTQKHIKVLTRNLEKVPPEARKGLNTALNASQKSHIEARKNIARGKGKSEKEIKALEEKIKEKIRSKEGIKKGPQICIQVITPAYNPETGKCKEFSTPCDVPSGWEKVKNCEEVNGTVNNRPKIKKGRDNTKLPVVK